MSGANAPRRRALVFGGSSPIGRFLLPQLASASLGAVVLTRDPSKARWSPDQASEWRPLSLAGLDATLETGERFDVVFHLAPLPGLGLIVETLARHGVRRLIAFGTTSHFYKLESRDPAERLRIRAFLEAETLSSQACDRAGIRWTLFRPTMVYGNGSDANVALVAGIARRFGVFPLMQGGRGLRQPVHAEDLAVACLQALDRPVTHGRSYDLSGGETLSYRAMVERIFAAVGRHPRLIDVPLPLFRLAVRLARVLPAFRDLSPEAALRQGVDLCFDHGPATEDFGYAPRAFTPDAASLPR